MGVSIDNRDNSIDFAKGVLIILVVLGHSQLPSNVGIIIYWFHMPAFFFISGLLWKGGEINLILLKNKIKKLFIPYLSFGILISIYNLVLHIYSSKSLIVTPFITSFIDLFYGGRLLKGNFGVFWFINVLIIINILMYSLRHQNKYLILLVIFFCYLAAHYLSLLYNDNTPDVLWNFDSLLYALPMFYFGFYLKPYLKILKQNWLGILLISVSFIIVVLQVKGYLKFILDIKYLYLKNVTLDIIVPLIFILSILYISSIFANLSLSYVINYLGRNSMIIMYLHIVANNFMALFWGGEYHYVGFLFIGITFPLIVMLIFKQSSLTKRIFLGQ